MYKAAKHNNDMKNKVLGFLGSQTQVLGECQGVGNMGHWLFLFCFVFLFLFLLPWEDLIDLCLLRVLLSHICFHMF